MLSPEQLSNYRSMTPGQRLTLTLKMIDWSMPQLLSGSREVVDRRFCHLQRENELCNRNILKGLADMVTQKEKKPFVVQAKNMGLKPRVDYSKTNQFVDELEVEAYHKVAQKLEERRSDGQQ